MTRPCMPLRRLNRQLLLCASLSMALVAGTGGAALAHDPPPQANAGGTERAEAVRAEQAGGDAAGAPAQTPPPSAPNQAQGAPDPGGPADPPAQAANATPGGPADPPSHAGEPGPAPAGRSAPAGNPPGNNGTVKVDGLPFDDHPNNEPHVDCTFQIDFYGFDAGDLDAEVIFRLQAPTTDGTLVVAEGDRIVHIGEDDSSGGGSVRGLDASETYRLSFPGVTPHPKQGYHVKLTVHAEGSQGADTKHKVFWVRPCGVSTPPAPPTTAPPTTVPPTTVPPTTVPPTTVPPANTVIQGGTPTTTAVAGLQIGRGINQSAAAVLADTPARPARVLGVTIERGAPAEAAAAGAPAARVMGISAARGANLARTGLGVMELLTLGVFVLLAGVCAVRVARRKEAASTPA